MLIPIRTESKHNNKLIIIWVLFEIICTVTISKFRVIVQLSSYALCGKDTDGQQTEILQVQH